MSNHSKIPTMKDIPPTLNGIIENAIKSYWSYDALSDFDGVNYRYADVAEWMAKIHILFDAAGIKEGDKVAICGKNSSDWMIVFLSCLTFGAVAVPILHEFNAESITNLTNHSEAKLLFADKAILDKLDAEKLPQLSAAFYISENGLAFSRNQNISDTRNRLNEIFGEKYPENFTAENVKYIEDKPDQLAIINYTSGSTGTPKGVMLPYRSIWSNIAYCIVTLTYLYPGDGMVNMLPLGHMYGMVIESLHPFVKGVKSNFLTKAPSPKVLLGAFARVKPKLIITVPLVLEKIIKGNIFPKLRTPAMRIALHIPILNNFILGKVREKIMTAFGGSLREIIIGGAPLNPDVEKFLYRIKFPLTVGYGMTECGPLLTYAPSSVSKPQTVGRIMDRMEVKIDSEDPQHVPGNILVKGENVMLGYYKNPEATKEVFPYGNEWLNTGDMGTIDKDGFISISGRSKTMILGPSGQNIYPEEIEHKINNLPYVEESLVIDEGGKLVALIYPNYEEAEKNGLDHAELDRLMDTNLNHLNKSLESFSRISSHRLMDTEFEKTPKRSIKRFLYQK